MHGTAQHPPLPGADSETWRRFGLAPGLFLAGTGLLLQVAHPVVGAGVLEHSDFKNAPWKRLVNTHLSTMRFIYGMRPGADAEGSRLWELHKDIKGVDGRGRRYHALNPEAYAWVHFTLAQFVVDTAELFGDPMTPAETERMWQEFRAIGRALQLKEHHMPADWASAQVWFRDVVRNRLEATESTYDVLESISDPPRPYRWIPRLLWAPIGRPFGRIVRMTTIGTMPPELRERMGLQWSAQQERRLRRFGRLVGGMLRALPWPLRYTPFALPAILRDKRRIAASRPARLAGAGA